MRSVLSGAVSSVVFVLNCILFYFIVMRCVAFGEVRCGALRCAAVSGVVLYCIVLYCIVLLELY